MSFANASYEKTLLTYKKWHPVKAELKVLNSKHQEDGLKNLCAVRRKTSVAPKDLDKLIAKLVSYIIHVRRVQEKQKYELAQIIVMDETPVWSNLVSATTINATGKKTSL